MNDKMSKKNIINLGAKLKELREDKKLTVEQISEKLNYSPQAYSHWENGRRSISIDVLKKLSSILKFTTTINEGELYIYNNSINTTTRNNLKNEEEIMMNVIFRKAVNGPLQPITIKVNNNNFFENIKEKISASTIAVIRIREDIAVLIDEDAPLKCNPKTNFWYDAWFSKDGTEHKLMPQWILGDIIFVGVKYNNDTQEEQFESLTGEQSKFIDEYING